jgi:trehalose 6-phosphate phosphatase
MNTLPPPPPTGNADCCFFLDVDGTLLDIAPRPDAVRVTPATLALLGRLRLATGGALALVSGRSIADLDRLFAPHRFAAAGQHGTERRGADGMPREACTGDPLRESLARLRALARVHDGLLVEDKGCSIALHYRAAPGLEPFVRAIAAEESARIGNDCRVLPGKMVFELRSGHRDKGQAIAAFLREAPFRDRVPVFIGDDVSDEPGFAAVNAHQGLSIKVGEGPSLARHALADADAVLRWLSLWIARRAAPPRQSMRRSAS